MGERSRHHGVSDDDRDEIDADAILEGLSQGTEETNEYRVELGYSPIHVVGWFERPRYDEPPQRKDPDAARACPACEMEYFEHAESCSECQFALVELTTS